MALQLFTRLLATRASLRRLVHRPAGLVGGARSNSTALSVTTALLPAAPKPAAKPQAITKVKLMVKVYLQCVVIC